MLTGFYEVESRFVLDGKYPDWVRIDDNIENSIWSEMDESGLHLSEKTLHNIINSDFSESFDPLDDYLRSLPKWKKGEDATTSTSSPTASRWRTCPTTSIRRASSAISSRSGWWRW